MILLCANIRVVLHNVKNGEIICFGRINWRITQICVKVVVAYWKIPLDKLEWNFSIGMVDGFNFLKYSIPTPSIEIDIQPENYYEWTFPLITWHLSVKSCVHLYPNLLCLLRNIPCHLPAQCFFQGCKYVAYDHPFFQFLECNILNENPKFCMI